MTPDSSPRRYSIGWLLLALVSAFNVGTHVAAPHDGHTTHNGWHIAAHLTAVLVCLAYLYTEPAHAR